MESSLNSQETILQLIDTVRGVVLHNMTDDIECEPIGHVSKFYGGDFSDFSTGGRLRLLKRDLRDPKFSIEQRVWQPVWEPVQDEATVA